MATTSLSLLLAEAVESLLAPETETLLVDICATELGADVFLTAMSAITNLPSGHVGRSALLVAMKFADAPVPSMPPRRE